jgi:hypothetical protein
MGILLDKVKLSLLVNGDGVPENFKKNSNFFYEKYLKSDDDVKNIPIANIVTGGFYFLHYKHDSNWMKWSPIFVADYKKLNNQVVFLAVNFNFIPLEVRVSIFDKYITEKDFDKNNYIKVNYDGMYKELRTLGFEYALMEFNAIQIVASHKISMNVLPRFLYSQPPKNIYDPKKLIEIWSAKIKTRDQRDKEIMISNLDDFFNINKEISDKYDELYKHIKRIRTNMIKYGKG